MQLNAKMLYLVPARSKADLKQGQKSASNIFKPKPTQGHSLW